MAKLKALVTKIEDVPEALREFYATVDGKVVLQVQGVDGFELEDVSGLKGALAQEKEERRKAKEALAAFDGVDAKAAREAIAKVKELGNLDPAKEADRIAAEKLEQLKQQLVKGHEDALGAKDVEIQGLTGEISRLLVDAVATQAIAGAKGVPELLLPHVKAKTRVRKDGDKFVVEVLDEKGNPRVNGKAEPFQIGDLVEEMKASPTFGRAFEGSGASGSGAAGSAGRTGGGGAGTPKHRGDFPDDKSKATYIRENGLGAFQGLPDPPKAA